MAGTVSVERSYNRYAEQIVEIVDITWTADAAAATVPDTSIENLFGFLIKAVTKPGGTAPTAASDAILGDPQDSTLDALGGALTDKITTTTQQVYPVVSGGNLPVYLAGDYTFKISNNAVNSATGTVRLYILKNL